ncbi:MAG: hypothetical protein IKH85_07025 [Methanobrevibacter sp.]|uniref:hypothetical protein n=1 Tax=Methanobrevibacter sp. TaxID=66852 RepID=UPI0025E10088|nr:hypothetical protein [Methanobrevibacter sp.]MBR6993809.1 hypothetical protein [Methanobrevibacter sp.]
MAEGRRVQYDDVDRDLYDEIRSKANPLKKLKIMDIFAIALMYGKKTGIRTPMDKKTATGRIRQSTIDSSNLRYLMMAIASDEDKSIDVVANTDDYFKICEEYAKTGIDLLHEDVFDRGNDILEDMQDELLRFYDTFIEE